MCNFFIQQMTCISYAKMSFLPAESVLTLSANLNTTRFPNVSPYNVFRINCTATVPAGVVAPKTFEWKRRKGNRGLLNVSNRDSFDIVNSGLDMLTSTSILTVTERSSGTWTYRCKVKLVDVSTTEDSGPQVKLFNGYHFSF